MATDDADDAPPLPGAVPDADDAPPLPGAVPEAEDAPPPGVVPDGVPFEVKEAATKALKKGCLPLSSHARRSDADQLTALIERARKSDVDDDLIQKAESLVATWWTQVERHEAIDVLYQAFFRMDLDGDGFIDKDEWGSMMARLEGPTWKRKVLEDMFVRVDRNRDRRLDYEELVSRLLDNDAEGHKLVKEIVRTPPNQDAGFVGLFGPQLLKGTAYKEFPIDTVEALADANVIGVIFMTSSTIDKQLYPPSLLQQNKELLRRVASLYLDLRDPEIRERPSEKFEVVLCSFDTTWDAFTRTVGKPGPPAPWMVIPYDAPWERDFLWRKFNRLFKIPTDPALVILKPNLEVITVKGFSELDIPRKLLFRLYAEWVAEAEGRPVTS
ncbi:unnamed protein product [Effrenium voratum]|nr:unnamed protein product [Effrenium voratum]